MGFKHESLTSEISTEPGSWLKDILVTLLLPEYQIMSLYSKYEECAMFAILQ
jgi:hypothetical protein